MQAPLSAGLQKFDLLRTLCIGWIPAATSAELPEPPYHPVNARDRSVPCSCAAVQDPHLKHLQVESQMCKCMPVEMESRWSRGHAVSRDQQMMPAVVALLVSKCLMRLDAASQVTTLPAMCRAVCGAQCS